MIADFGRLDQERFLEEAQAREEIANGLDLIQPAMSKNRVPEVMAKFEKNREKKANKRHDMEVN